MWVFLRTSEKLLSLLVRISSGGITGCVFPIFNMNRLELLVEQIVDTKAYTKLEIV